MPFIAFLGCDGSGKSAVIRGVAERLTADGHPVALGHWRPKPFGSSQGPSPAADDPHGQAPRGLVTSVLKLGWLWLNWWVAWFQHLRRASRDGYLLFDRYHADLLVDPQRYRYGGPMFLARLASRCMPQPDLVIYLDAEPEILLSRKQEVASNELIQARRSYLQFATKTTSAVIVDASMSLDEVESRVQMEIAKNLKAHQTPDNP
jgi:thymidylate kinase